MIDYNVSVIARLEHEERVRSLAPVQEYDDRLKDDRSLSTYPIRAGVAAADEDQSSQPGLLYTVGSVLVTAGEWMRNRPSRETYEYDLTSHARSKNSGVLG